MDGMLAGQVILYDTTLRDGAQSEAISLSVDDKLKITHLLDRLGVQYIEGGWPGSNPKDSEYFQRVRAEKLEQILVAAFGRTCRVGTRPADDVNIRALLAAETPVVTVVGKSWTLHVRDVLRASLEENLHIIRESLTYLRAQGREVIYDAEHFFDGYKADPSYALATLQSVVDGGVDTIVLCDTNGGSMPWDVESITHAVRAAFPNTLLGIHAHNDGGLAVANSLAAVRAGGVVACQFPGVARGAAPVARMSAGTGIGAVTGVAIVYVGRIGGVHVQGTMNGHGERCGNADLCSLIPNFELKLGLNALPSGGLARVTRTARTVAAIANQPLHRQAPYVGQSAFAHKGGIHVAAMRRNPQSYQHVDPTLVGNESRVLVSELSGRGNLVSKADEMGISPQEMGDLQSVLTTIKGLEHRGFTFEGAEASVELLIRRTGPGYCPPFEMVDFMVVVEHREGRGTFAEATIKVQVGDSVMHTVAEGNGPVDALYAALCKALLPVYPHMDSFRLVDYKVWILDSDKATAATTRVLIDTQNSTCRWSSVGASPNIIEASWLALADAVEYGLTVNKTKGSKRGGQWKPR